MTAFEMCVCVLVFLVLPLSIVPPIVFSQMLLRNLNTPNLINTILLLRVQITQIN